MRVAVIGGGLFGSTAAIHAARAGHEVHLYEARRDLMCGATAGTYSRLHRGYHYPRSPETGRESRRAEASFRAEYGAAVIDAGEQFYLVPSQGSRIDGEAYRVFLEAEDLPFTEGRYIFSVSEPRIHLALLQDMIRQKVWEAGVQLHLGTAAHASLRRHYDRIVVAAYAGLNQVLGELGCAQSEYKFQVVERPVVQLPDCFKDTSIVVIDGPFGCVDPLDDSPHHVVGHVTRTIHAENVGLAPIVPDYVKPLLETGGRPAWSRFREVVEDLAKYIPGLSEAVHIRSSFVVRAVLAHQEATDARPTLVEKMDDQVIKVFSGKLGTAVRAAEDVLAIIEEKVEAEQVAA